MGTALRSSARPTAVERFLRAEVLWDVSQSFDLDRLRSLLGIASDVAQAASDIAANSGRWIKLTPESAQLVKEYGLMEAKTPGLRHLMVGVPGKVGNWLQTEKGVEGVGSLLANPAALSSVAGLMAQVAGQQTMAEITDYLVRIDAKVDDVLGKVDDTVLKDMRGARFQIRRAHTMRDLEGRVTSDSWSEVQNASGKLADVQSYALLQLEAIAKQLESEKRVGGLATASEEARSEVQKWLAVLADCFREQESFDVLALDRAMVESPAALNARRQGLEADRNDRLELIFTHTMQLLTRMDAAVGTANKKMLWTRNKSLAVIDSGNDLALEVQEFHDLLGIEAVTSPWEAKAARTRRGRGFPGHPEVEGRGTRRSSGRRAGGHSPRRKGPSRQCVGGCETWLIEMRDPRFLLSRPAACLRHPNRSRSRSRPIGRRG
jgi:hypothetical protein